jgi:hypothetical protein
MPKDVDDKNLMPKKQIGCCRGSKGCDDQLLISRKILKECKAERIICLWRGLSIRKFLTGCYTVG